MTTIYNVVVQSKSPTADWRDIETFQALDDTFELSAFDKEGVAKIRREFRQDLPKYKVRTVNRKEEIATENFEELKEKHEKIRTILIDYGNEEFGDCIIDEICEAVGIQPTTVYYEE